MEVWMRIQELQDVLTIVDELPREQQLKCVRSCSVHVQEWEARMCEPPMTDRQWMDLKRERLKERLNEKIKRLSERRRPE